MSSTLLSWPQPGSDAPSRVEFDRALQCSAQSRKHEAAQAYMRALQLRPGYFEAAFNLGVLFQELGQTLDAVRCYRYALSYQPNFAQAWGNLGIALREMGEGAESIASFEQALRCQPDHPEILNNLGNALVSELRYSQAIDVFRRALELAPANPGIHLNLGDAWRASGQIDLAIRSLRHALELQPDFAEAHWSLAFALLLQGNFSQGLGEYEWRWRRPDFPRRPFPAPIWQGQSLVGRTLLVHSEQGAGDAIQFARFVSRLPALGARVILECPASLLALFQSLSGVDQLVRHGDPLPAFDFHVPLLSLPHRLGVSLASLRTATPYLEAPSDRNVHLPTIARSGEPRLRIGVVWRGNPKHINDRHRSLPLPALDPLFSLPQFAWYSLQLPSPAQPSGEAAVQPPLIDLASALRDFADTASALAQLDLVISVDTSVAHLAGAIDKPVWVLLPFAPDWRWLLHRDDSPWYRAARLFRQPAPGDWTGVVARVRQALLEYPRLAPH